MIQPRYICDCCLRRTCRISLRRWCVGCETEFTAINKLLAVPCGPNNRSVSVKYIATLILLALTGCALEPNAIRFEGEHVSHVSQHFGDHPTGYGFDAISLVAHWQAGHAYLDVSEGINVSPAMKDVIGPVYGDLAGPRETFQARAGYEFPLKP